METKETRDVGVETNRLPMGAVIIQKEKEKKKKSKMQKRQIKSIPNAVPSQEQQFRIFQNIDYPYMMRNVEVQNEEDKMVRALREVFGIKEKTPEMVADEAIQKAYSKGRSYPLYTDAELTEQEKRARIINSDKNDIYNKIASVSGLFDDDDRDAPSAFNASVDKYMSYLADFRKEYWGEEVSKLMKESSLRPSGYLTEEQLQAKMSAFNPSRQPYNVAGLSPVKTIQEVPSFITNQADFESLIGVMESTGIDKQKQINNRLATRVQEALRNKIASDRFKEALEAQSRRHQFQLDLFAKEEERRIQDIKNEFKRYDYQKEKAKQPSLLAEEDIFAGMEIRQPQQEEDIVKKILSQSKSKTQKETSASTRKPYRGKPLEEPLLSGERQKKNVGRPKGSLNKYTYEGMLNL